MKLLTFQKPNKFYFFFLLYFIAIFTRLLLNSKVFISENKKANYFFRMFSYILSHILSFIPYFISQYRSKRREISDKNKLVTNYIYNEIPNKYKWKYLAKPILFLSLFGFFAEAPYYLFYMLTDKTYQSIYSLGIYSIINAVLIYIFSYLILKTYFYKHHYLSFLINSICFMISLIMDIIALINMKQKDYKYYINIILRILRLNFKCVLYCLSKKELQFSLLTPYSIIAFRSIYETIFLVIFSIPFTFIPIKDYNKNEGEILFAKFSIYFTDIRILYTILLFIDNYLIDISIMLIIDKFSPSHLALQILLESFAEEAYSIISSIINKNDIYWQSYVNLGIHLIVFIGTMIHNEIFIINKCGLNEKTQLYLNNEFKKENIDNKEIIDNLDEIINEEDRESIEMDYVKRNENE